VSTDERKDAGLLLDRARRLFEFLARAQQLRTDPPRTIDAYRREGQVLWFADLPEHPAVAPAQRGGDPEPLDDVLRVDRVPRLDPPEPGADLHPWLDGPIHDPERVPALREHRSVQDADGGTETLALVDQPEVQPEVAAAFPAWLARWRAWAQDDREARPARALYEQLFSTYVTHSARPEELELVVAVGCLSWAPDPAAPVQRHLFTAPAAIEFDEATARLTVRPVETAGGLTLELDMLDPSKVADHSKMGEVRRAAGAAEFHVLQRDDVGQLARRIVHVLDARGRYLDDDVATPPADDATASFAPALILRKRSRQGIVQLLQTIASQLAEAGAAPEGLLPLVDADHRPDAGQQWDPSQGALVTVDGDPFLPLPVNDRQLQVIRKVDAAAQTLVQGPPGTGKTHTAAALIAHLLAQGRRVLVTAHTDRALREVRQKLPEAIQPLSVAVVGGGREDMADLKVAVQRIAQEAGDHDPDAAADTIATCLSAIDRLRRDRADTYRRLVDAREREVRRRVRPPYEGTLADIAQRHAAGAETLGWITDVVSPSPDDPPPLTSAEVRAWHGAAVDGQLAADAPEAHRQLVALEAVPDPGAFADLVWREQQAGRAAGLYERDAEDPAVRAILGLPAGERADLRRRLDALVGEADDLARRRERWLAGALADVLDGRGGPWRARAQQIEQLVHAASSPLDALGPLRQVRVRHSEPAALVPLARELHQHLAGGNRLRVGPDGRPKVGAFGARAVRQAAALFDAVLVDGLPPTSPEQVYAFLAWAETHRVLAALDQAWPRGVEIPEEDTPHERLAWHRAELDLLRRVLALADALVAEERRLAAAGIPLPRWRDLDVVRALVDLVDVAALLEAAALATEPLTRLEGDLAGVARRGDAAPSVKALRAAVAGREVESYRPAHARLARLHQVRALLERHDQLDQRLRAAAPRLHRAVLDDALAPEWPARLDRFEDAWAWAATGAWIREQESADVNALQAEVAGLEDRIRRLVEQLAAVRAWTHAVSPDRLTGGSRAELIHYAQLVKGFGRTGGKYAAAKQAEIRKSMDRCRGSVPVWIMPLYRIAEQFDIKPDMFDVIIVDEASQAGMDAVFLQYLAPKIVVIGDDKQVSPSAVGVDVQQLMDLAAQFLYDDTFIGAFTNPQRSLFDEARMRYGGVITLTEHRRCVAEIIGFSNRIAYEPEGIRLVPVRLYGADRLEPIKPVHVSGGYVTGTTNKVNPAEVDAVVDQIEKCNADPAYGGKSFGVVSLLGPTQAKAIQAALLARLSPEEFAARDLRCGDAADFQGSERDVMFLSMVAAPEPGRRLTPLTGEQYVQRFNVAASRAKDQMWVFHSMALGDLHNTEDMRFQLLDYCYGVAGRSSADLEGTISAPVPEDAPVDPFDSLFEQRVHNRIVDRGYSVVPQYEAQGYRIDLVIVGAKGRLAVECDGDEWHGPDAYQRDLARQRDLERCGWRFFRVRESAFSLDPAAALAPLWDLLDGLDIHPSGWTVPTPEAAVTPAPEAVPEEAVAEPPVPATRPAPVEAPPPREPEPVAPFLGGAELPVVPQSGRLHADVAGALREPEPEVPSDEDAGLPRTSEDGRLRVDVARPSREPEPGAFSDGEAGLPRTPEGGRLPMDVARPFREPEPEVPDGAGLPGVSEGGRLHVDVAPPAREAPAEAPPVPAVAAIPPSGILRTRRRSGDLEPYQEFDGRVTPVAQAASSQLIDGLVRIVGTEGPVVGSRLHAVYVRAAGGQRVGPQIGRDLRSATAAAVRGGLLVEDNPLGRIGIEARTYRLPDQPEVRLRALGPRQLDEMPPAELAAFMRRARTTWGQDEEGWYRATLDVLGLRRLTPAVRNRLQAVATLIEPAPEETEPPEPEQPAEPARPAARRLAPNTSRQATTEPAERERRADDWRRGFTRQQWEALIDRGHEFLVERAVQERDTSYTEFCTVMNRRARVYIHPHDEALSPILDAIANRSFAERRVALTAIVRYADGNTAGPGFFALAQRLGLLPQGRLTEDDRLEFYVRHVREVFAAYATSGRLSAGPGGTAR